MYAKGMSNGKVSHITYIQAFELFYKQQFTWLSINTHTFLKVSGFKL